MWMKNGSMLSGHYGKWNGKDVELLSCESNDGTLTLIHDGERSPGEEWNRLTYPNRFARGPIRYYLEVPEKDVKSKIIVESMGSLNRTKAKIVAEDNGKFAVEIRDATTWMKEVREQHDLELHEDGYVYGWIPSLDVVSIVTKLTKVR